jgi:hypothetical protein
MCSHCLFPVVVTSLEQVVITGLLQVVPTRLIQAVRNKLLRACCHKLVNNLLRADDIRLVGTTFSESVGLINLVNKSANKLSQIYSQAVDKLCSHCLFPVIEKSLEQAVNNL